MDRSEGPPLAGAARDEPGQRDQAEGDAKPSERSRDRQRDAAKEAAEHELQQTLIWRTKEMQAVGAACWVRARRAEGLIK